MRYSLGAQEMSPYKIIGACTLCDKPCFEVMAMHSEGERLAGEPKQLGPPLEGATRITYMLFDGTKTSLTFCADCAKEQPTKVLAEIWQKNIRSWMRELATKPESERMPEWFQRQFSNGLLCEMGRQLWTEAVKQNA